MEKTTKALLVFTQFVMAFLTGAEGGRDVPMKDDQVYQPQNFDFGFTWPFLFPFSTGFCIFAGIPGSGYLGGSPGFGSAGPGIGGDGGNGDIPNAGVGAGANSP